MPLSVFLFTSLTFPQNSITKRMKSRLINKVNDRKLSINRF